MMSAHCLICNLSLKDSYKHFDVFSLLDSPMNKQENGRIQDSSLFEEIAQILNRPLSSIILHSQVLCQVCYSRVIEILDIRDKYHKLQLDFITSFDQTAFAHTQLSNTNEILLSLTEPLTSDLNDKRNEESTLGNLSNIAFGKSTSGEIGTSVKNELKETVTHSNGEVGLAVDQVANSGKQYVCEKCGKTFSANSHWVEHMLVHIDVKPHKCAFCDKLFRTLSTLKVHERAHTGLKPFECEVCGKSFSERHYLTEHSLVHADRKPFKCSVCDREFTRRKDMVTHTKLHSEERPHCCPLCPKKFVVKSRLNRHLKTHSLERPHQCKICLKSFVRLNDFKVHERLHTGVKPYKCSHCDRCFSSLSNFRAHERRHKGTSNTKIVDGNLASEQTDVKTTFINQAVAKEQSSGIALMDNNVQQIPFHQQNNEVIPPPQPAIFPVAECQQEDMAKMPLRLPSLVNFCDQSEKNKNLDSTLPLDTDISSLTLPNEDGSVHPQQSVVLMQFPLMQEPPPLVLYSAPRNSDQAAQLANSMLTETPLNSSFSQLQVLRWDNADDVDNVLFHDNSNGPMLANTLF